MPGFQRTAQSGATSRKTLSEWLFERAREAVRIRVAYKRPNRVLWNRYVLPRLGGRQFVVLAHQPEIVQESRPRWSPKA
jgi:hypothetical protein